MREAIWSTAQIERALDYNGPLMRIDPKTFSDRREVPKYTLTEVSLYLGIKTTTLYYWFFGHRYTVRGEHRFSPPLATPAARNPRGPSLSFYNLAEAHVLSATRQRWGQKEPDQPVILDESLALVLTPKFGRPIRRRKTEFRISMRSLRNAIEYVAATYPSQHPLISQQFYTNGKQLFIKSIEEEVGDQLVINASRSGQLGLASILDTYLERIDRDPRNGWPLRIYPVRDVEDRDRSIVIISNVASGRPVIAGTGIRAEVVWNRACAGEPVEVLAEDYEIDPSVIKKAIAYFTDVKAA